MFRKLDADDVGHSDKATNRQLVIANLMEADNRSGAADIMAVRDRNSISWDVFWEEKIWKLKL